MKILYVAKHASGDNDDEGAILYAFKALGHHVVATHEKRRHRTFPIDAHGFDLCLFHKWPNADEIAKVARTTPCALWYFDKVQDGGDPTLTDRSASRIAWFRAVAPHCRAAFCTDGDWVADAPAVLGPAADGCKFVHLSQGADERAVGKATWEGAGPDILFTGMVNHGRDRASHVTRLRARWGGRFQVVGDTGPRHRVHGDKLAALLASAKVVVAPDGPCTDRYWSNRVYLTLGFGGFLLHPYRKGLTEHYYPGVELIYYYNRDQLDWLIEFYLGNAEARNAMADAGYRRTLESNLYRHRCADLIKTMEGLL